MKPPREYHRPRQPSPDGQRWAASLLILTLPGCSAGWVRWVPGGWVNDYQSAERLAEAPERPLFILYRTKDRTAADPMFDALNSHEIKPRTSGCVRCCLFHSNASDRRYVAQFGVQRAPAVILIHADGTYHAQTGPQSGEQLARFFDAAHPPGTIPAHDPFISRQATYAWMRSLDAAQSAAKSQNRSVLIVLDRWMSRDWRRLHKLLDRPEVHARFVNMIHCRPGGVLGGGGAVAQTFGVTNLPALVILQPDGSHHALELPTSYESVIRFADARRLKLED